MERLLWIVNLLKLRNIEGCFEALSVGQITADYLASNLLNGDKPSN